MLEETEKVWFQMQVDPEGRDRMGIFHLDAKEEVSAEVMWTGVHLQRGSSRYTANCLEEFHL